MLIALLFAAIYKVLPEKMLLWRDVILGAMTTSLLFEVGQVFLGVYLGSSAIASPYGAAGGLIVLLLWVYYSAQVFLLGAELMRRVVIAEDVGKTAHVLAADQSDFAFVPSHR